MKDARCTFCIRVNASHWVAVDEDFRLADTTWLREARCFDSYRDAMAFIDIRLQRSCSSNVYQIVQFLFVQVESVQYSIRKKS